MCPGARHYILNPGKCLDMTEKLLTGTLQTAENHEILPRIHRERKNIL